jgi:hypothetical protein
MHIIDSHIHCGVQNVSQPYEVIRPLLEAAGIAGACLFAPADLEAICSRNILTLINPN